MKHVTGVHMTALVLFSIIAFSTSALAEDWLPDGPVDALWRDAANWSLGHAPNRNDSESATVDTATKAILDQTGSALVLTVAPTRDATVRVNGTDVVLSCHSVTLGGSLGTVMATGTIELAGAGSLYLSEYGGELALGPTQYSNGVITITGDGPGLGNLDLEDGIPCFVGKAGAGHIDQGTNSGDYPTAVLDGRLYIGGGTSQNNTASGTYSLLSGSLELPASPFATMYVGYGGEGSFTLGCGNTGSLTRVSVVDDVVIRQFSGATGVFQGSQGEPTSDIFAQTANTIYIGGGLINNGVVRADGYGLNWALDFRDIDGIWGHDSFPGVDAGMGSGENVGHATHRQSHRGRVGLPRPEPRQCQDAHLRGRG